MLSFFHSASFYKIFFWMIAVLSVSKSFCDAKFELMWFLFKGGLNRFVKLAFNLTCMVTSVYGTSVLSCKGNALNKMVENITTYEKNWTAKTNRTVFSAVLVGITATLAALKSLLVMGKLGIVWIIPNK